jgi:hypothetical protein
MVFESNPKLASAYWELYSQGFSCAEIAKAHGVSRQSVWELLNRHEYPLRKKKKLPFVLFEGVKYTLGSNGYYRATSDKRSLLHRDIWISRNGQIPDGFDIHHRNESKQDNRIENLECLSKAVHSVLHNSGATTQFKPGQKPHNAKRIKRLDTGKIYLSARDAGLDVGRNPSAITQSIKNGTKSAGTYWEWID